jgi:hypothetical protein
LDLKIPILLKLYPRDKMQQKKVILIYALLAARTIYPSKGYDPNYHMIKFDTPSYDQTKYNVRYEEQSQLQIKTPDAELDQTTKTVLKTKQKSSTATPTELSIKSTGSTKSETPVSSTIFPEGGIDFNSPVATKPKPVRKKSKDDLKKASYKEFRTMTPDQVNQHFNSDIYTESEKIQLALMTGESDYIERYKNPEYASKADIDARTAMFKTIINAPVDAIENRPLHILIQTMGDYTEKLEKYKDDPIAQQKIYDKIKNAMKTFRLLVNQPTIECNAVNKFGQTPLHAAAINNQIPVIKILLSMTQVDPNIEDTMVKITKENKDKTKKVGHKASDYIVQDTPMTAYLTDIFASAERLYKDRIDNQDQNQLFIPKSKPTTPTSWSGNLWSSLGFGNKGTVAPIG